jgi:cholest-4-en-3-one 26-monooxygenase
MHIITMQRSGVATDWSYIDNNLLNPSFYATQEYRDVFKTLRDEDPVHWTVDERYGKNYWAITRYDDVKEVLSDHRRFSSRWHSRVPRTPKRLTPEERHALVRDADLTAMDEPMHSVYRRPMNKHFSVPAVARLGDFVDDVVDGIIRDVSAAGECDLVDDLTGELPMRVILGMLGIPEEDWPMIREASWQFMAGADPRFTIDGDPIKTSLHGQRRLLEYCGQLALERRKNPKDDFATAISNVEIDGDKLSLYEMHTWFFLVIFGGLETTRNTAATGLWLFLENPDQREKLIADPSLMPGAIEEIVRWCTPSKNRLRIANEDMDFGGKRIRAGDWVVVYQASANFDERAFDDPARFDIERNSEHLGFGIGTHLCIGRNLARLEMSSFFTKVLSAFPDMQRKDSGEPKWLQDANATGFSEMRVTYTPKEDAA